MSRYPARCTQADIARAIRAVEQTGARMAVEIAPDGTIRIVPYDGPASSPANDPVRHLEADSDFVL
ncbi:hypothetical protein [Methylocystis sp. ATCC 49242]|uniref:hypothetical protein n=1 Tax=Methylocystis sp. ATCC 49242 TaxID=622637 RepID=UPI0002FFBD2B|nr:hypothetical protein [Methylocystis sp. ATCC 49242]